MSDSEKAKETPAKGQKPRSLGSKIWYFFNSLKLTLTVLITLAIVSIFGTIIEQNLQVDRYLGLYGEKWTSFILSLGLNDMYHSWWFSSLLGMLALNIIVCTFERFPPKWKSLLHHKSDFDPKFIERLSNNHSLTVSANADAVRDKALAHFKSRRFKTMVSGSKGEHKIYAWKGMIGRFGSDFTHISLLVILLGTIIGSFAGYKDFRTIMVGDVLALEKADFQLHLDKFWIEYYDSGQVKQYNSILTVIEDGKPVMSKQIWVNEPLYYKGIRFYQASYGMSWNKLDSANLAVKKKGATDFGEPFELMWQQMRRLPGTDLSLKLAGYAADFAFDRTTGTIYSKSAEPNNPAILLEVYRNGTHIASSTVFLKYPGVFPPIPGSDLDIAFVDYQGTLYSGLSINKDPGTNVVWVGTAIMGFGFILAFFIYHRRIWISIRETGKSTEVKVGGMINKNNMVLEKEINEIVDAVKG